MCLCQMLLLTKPAALCAGTCVQTRTGHQRGIQDLALSKDGWSVLTGSDDSTARVFAFSA